MGCLRIDNLVFIFLYLIESTDRSTASIQWLECFDRQNWFGESLRETPIQTLDSIQLIHSVDSVDLLKGAFLSCFE